MRLLRWIQYNLQFKESFFYISNEAVFERAISKSCIDNIILDSFQIHSELKQTVASYNHYS